jgi:hypothetical protein
MFGGCSPYRLVNRYSRDQRFTGYEETMLKARYIGYP